MSEKEGHHYALKEEDRYAPFSSSEEVMPCDSIIQTFQRRGVNERYILELFHILKVL